MERKEQCTQNTKGHTKKFYYSSIRDELLFFSLTKYLQQEERERKMTRWKKRIWYLDASRKYQTRREEGNSRYDGVELENCRRRKKTTKEKRVRKIIPPRQHWERERDDEPLILIFEGHPPPKMRRMFIELSFFWVLEFCVTGHWDVCLLTESLPLYSYIPLSLGCFFSAKLEIPSKCPPHAPCLELQHIRAVRFFDHSIRRKCSLSSSFCRPNPGVSHLCHSR